MLCFLREKFTYQVQLIKKVVNKYNILIMSNVYKQSKIKYIQLVCNASVQNQQYHQHPLYVMNQGYITSEKKLHMHMTAYFFMCVFQNMFIISIHKHIYLLRIHTEFLLIHIFKEVIPT